MKARISLQVRQPKHWLDGRWLPTEAGQSTISLEGHIHADTPPTMTVAICHDSD